MKTFATAAGHVVRLDPGEEILETLTRFVRQEKIEGAVITGIGAVKEITLGYFDLHHREYRRREIPEDMELLSFSGNLTWVADEPLIHAHVVLSGSDYAALGGHLFAAEIAVTGEFWVQPTGRRIQRAPDPRSGLNLISDGEV